MGGKNHCPPPPPPTRRRFGPTQKNKKNNKDSVTPLHSTHFRYDHIGSDIWLETTGYLWATPPDYQLQRALLHQERDVVPC